MMKNNRLYIGLNDDLFSYDELQTMIDFVCTLLLSLHVSFVFVYSPSFCTSCTIS